ncbi:MAG: hypothetical protein L6R35_006485 [Caloplaca aegaea]|nr:MAG: hypothetical protein L6R35_006485 [Caloplaca aegaea]
MSGTYNVDPPSNAWKISVVDSVGLSLAVILLTIRCYTKLRITNSPGSDDATCLVSLLGFIVFVSLDFVQRFQYGGGRQTGDLPPSMYNGYLTTGAVGIYLYILGIMFAKVSLLLFLYRVFRADRRFRIASWVIGIVVVVWCLVSFLLMIFGCRPIKASWDVFLTFGRERRCNPKAYDVINIHVSLEYSLSITVACMPALAPFFKRYRVLASFIPSSIRSKSSTHSSNTQPAKREFSGSSTTQQGDVERDAVHDHAKYSHSSWQPPRAWNVRSLDEYDRMSQGSEVTLQPVVPTRREIDHKD